MFQFCHSTVLLIQYYIKLPNIKRYFSFILSKNLYLFHKQLLFSVVGKDVGNVTENHQLILESQPSQFRYWYEYVLATHFLEITLKQGACLMGFVSELHSAQNWFSSPLLNTYTCSFQPGPCNNSSNVDQIWYDQILQREMKEPDDDIAWLA